LKLLRAGQDLEAGRADLTLYTDEALPAAFRHLPLFVEGFAVMLRKGHPIHASRNQADHINPSLLLPPCPAW
jgi:DNA-binding transcriptional LysR family regulator